MALVGVPMDLGVTNRPGARFGPRAVRAVERIGPYHHVHRFLPLAPSRPADIGDVPFRSRYSLDDSIEDIEALFTRIAAAGVTPLAVGGDHSITFPILKALGAKRPVGLVHIDAHCDTGGPFEGAKFHHGGPFRQAVLAGVLDPERTIQIGIRGGAEYLWEFSYVSGMTVIHAEEFARLGVPKTIKKIHEVVGDGPTYISFDIDSLDPAFAPGTGTPEAGGLTHARGDGAGARLRRPQRDRRRRGRGGAAVRRDHQHRAGRGADAVRDPGRGGAGARQGRRIVSLSLCLLQA